MLVPSAVMCLASFSQLKIILVFEILSVLVLVFFQVKVLFQVHFYPPLIFIASQRSLPLHESLENLLVSVIWYLIEAVFYYLKKLFFQK